MIIGTVLPTAASLAVNEKFYRNTQKIKQSVASKLLAGLTRKTVGMETRYYKGASKYAIVNNSGKVLWFETRNGHDYAVKG